MYNMACSLRPEWRRPSCKQSYASWLQRSVLVCLVCRVTGTSFRPWTLNVFFGTLGTGTAGDLGARHFLGYDLER